MYYQPLAVVLILSFSRTRHFYSGISVANLWYINSHLQLVAVADKLEGNNANNMGHVSALKAKVKLDKVNLTLPKLTKVCKSPVPGHQARTLVNKLFPGWSSYSTVQ